jgi:predicted double-glycine peptidase
MITEIFKAVFKIKDSNQKYQNQHDLNGCGIACLANLFNKDYEQSRTEFEKNFYKINRGIKVSDLTKFINLAGNNYATKFFNHDNYNKIEAIKCASILNSISTN